MQESHGSVFIIQPFAEPNAKTRSRSTVSISNLLCAQVLNDQSLVCLIQSKLRKPLVLRRSLDLRDGIRRIFDQYEIMGRLETESKHLAVAFCTDEGGQQIMIQCSFKRSSVELTTYRCR